MEVVTQNGTEEITARIRELEQQVDEKNFAFETLFRLTEKLGTTLDLEKIVPLLTMTTTGQLCLNQMAFYLYSTESGKLEYFHSIGIRSVDLPGDISLDSNLIASVSRDDGILEIFESAGTDKSADGVEDIIGLFSEKGFSWAICLGDESDMIGLALIGEKIDGCGLSDMDIEILKTISRVATLAIRNALLYQDVTKSKNELIKFSRIKKEFMLHTSHEFRTPLTILKSTLWSIEPEDSQDKTLIELAQTAVNRLQEKIEQILSLNELGLNESSLDLRHTDMVALIGECITEDLTRMEESGIALRFDRNVDMKEVIVDPVKMKLVYKSVIENAISSVGKGGHIDINVMTSHAGPDEAEGIEIRAWQSDEGSPGSGGEKGSRKSDGAISSEVEYYFISRIKDDGVGIPIDEIKMMCEPFARASNSALGEVKGFGLGLSVSQKIIAGHGGRFYCKSDRGQGAEFSIWLPVINSLQVERQSKRC
ncbi:MAG: HAMP domain-containing histidine kinase [Candidatus Krumholzibacteriota bacterium]|nr:HAMP domain-containing histidine kinase [Candidatus Krumholzibacteriota bacterium]